MAARRMIASDIFEDELMLGLNYFDRLVWIGLFSVLADDQGRLLDSPALIRSKVFVYDQDVTDGMIENALNKIEKHIKITRYEKAGKRLIQINSWWKYQTPAWASPSKYTAPDGWTDRTKYHAAGNKVVTCNWDNIGGYVAGYVPPVHSGIEEGEGEVKGEVKGEVEGASPPPVLSPSIEAATIYANVTGVMGIPASQYEKVIPAMLTIMANKNGTSQAYCQPYFDAWVKRGYNKGNPAWLEWALAGEIPPAKGKRGTKNSQTFIASEVA